MRSYRNKPISPRLHRGGALDCGLAGAWVFNDRGRTADLSGHSRDLTLPVADANYVAGPQGQMYHGIGSTVRSEPDFLIGETWSLMLAFRYAATSGFRPLVILQNSSVGDSYIRTRASVDVLGFLIRGAGGNSEIQTAGWTPGQYYVGIWTFDVPGSRFITYRDGLQIGQVGAYFQLDTDGYNGLQIGQTSSNSIDISVMAQWDRVLTRDEISRLSADPYCLFRSSTSIITQAAIAPESPPPDGSSGVALTQSADAAFVDRPAGGGLGLRVDMAVGGDGQYLQADPQSDRSLLHTRFMLRHVDAAGGLVTVLRGLDAADSETFNLKFNTSASTITVMLATGHVMTAGLASGLNWHSIEMKLDAANGLTSLWINGREVATTTGSFNALATRRLWFGAPFKQNAVTGRIDLDEWIMTDEYIGPVHVDATCDTANDPARWLVIYNTASADSVTWVESYRAARGVPYANLLGLPLPTSETISESEYADLRQAVVDYLTLNKLDGQIIGILCGHAVPGMFTRSDGKAEAIAGQLHHLTDLTDDESNVLAPLDDEDPIVRPSASKLSSRFLTARIDGPTLADSLALTQRAAALDLSDGEQATIWLDPYGPDEDFYELRKQQMVDWSEGLDHQRTRLPIQRSAELDPGHDVQFTSIDRDAFFWGWEQAKAPAEFFAEPAGPRVFCLQLGSNFATAPTLRDADDTNWACAALKAGYAATAGSTRDFTPTGIPLIRPFFEALRRGWTLAEAWFVACPLLRTGLMLVGDPLMTVSMPQAGWDVYGPFESWKSVNFDGPIAMLRESERSITLADGQKPIDGTRGLYLVRHIDAAGRHEAGVSHVMIERAGDAVREVSTLPAWPNASGWSPMRTADGWRIEARWAGTFVTANVDRVSLVEHVQGAAEAMVQTQPVAPRDDRVVFTREGGEQPTRFRMQVTSIDGAVALTPWSRWVTQPPVTTQTIQSL